MTHQTYQTIQRCLAEQGSVTYQKYVVNYYPPNIGHKLTEATLLPGIMTSYGGNLSKTKERHKYRFRAQNNIKIILHVAWATLISVIGLEIITKQNCL